MRPPLPDPGSVRTLACLMINGIGDIICATPAIQALKARYARAELTVIVRPHLQGLLEGNPAVDRVLPYEVGSLWRRIAYLARLRRERFDLWVDLHMPTFNTVSSNARDFRRNALLARASGARYRLGYAVPALAPHLTHPVAVPDESRLRTENIVDTTVALIDPQAKGRYRKQVPVAASEREWARRTIEGMRSPRIALFFGSRQPADLWPDAHVQALIEQLARRIPSAELLLIGGEHEAALSRRLSCRMGADYASRVHDFIAKTSFGQTAALLEHCDAFLGTDSGAMHIADAVGIPIVALFSSKNYSAIWRPISPASAVLNHPVACGPCFRAECPRGNECMARIEPREALEALLRMLEPGRGDPAEIASAAISST